IHPFRDDRRSKSIEEREEEYQRVRERIFAQDVSSCFNCLFSAVFFSVVRQYPPPLHGKNSKACFILSKNVTHGRSCLNGLGVNLFKRLAMQISLPLSLISLI
uniref:SUZ domain-containing protein n=1 Tax=Crocodylus porosus TaxID=8502 RepID=A0A7M4FWY3_CROPO